MLCLLYLRFQMQFNVDMFMKYGLCAVLWMLYEAYTKAWTEIHIEHSTYLIFIRLPRFELRSNYWSDLKMFSHVLFSYFKDMPVNQLISLDCILS